MITKLFRFYVLSSTHVAFAVLSLLYLTHLHFELSWQTNLFAFIFCATVGTYNFIRYYASPDTRSSFNTPILVFSLISALGMCLSATKLTSQTLLVALLLGMMSLTYARIGRNDERVKAVIEWLNRNYTLDENPGMGSEGLYYYYHLMAKALHARSVKQLKGPKGMPIDWRVQLADKLISLQRPDGSWQNPTKRWMEGDANLTTTYVLMALALIQSK